MTTIFEKIINKEIPSILIYEDDVCIAIMDKFPSTEGQCLVIPREAVEYAFDLDEKTYTHILQVAKKLVKAIDQALNPLRTCLVIEGFQVPHAHVKLYPVYEKKIVTDSGPEAEDERLQELAENIKSYL